MKKLVFLFIFLSIKSHATINNGKYICVYEDKEYGYTEILKLNLTDTDLRITYAEDEIFKYSNTEVKKPLIIDEDLNGYYSLIRSKDSIKLDIDMPASLCTASYIGECENIEDEFWRTELKLEDKKVIYVMNFTSESGRDETAVFNCKLD